ncbi:MAG: class I SAM-dependent methyltransferase [Anaerolineae bacterium]|nr:class I SAM-dependent methyltransferase [Anaerolineae bacterium]
MELVVCNLCGSSRTRLRFPSTLSRRRDHTVDFRCTSDGYGIHPPIVQCLECGLVYANPRYESSEIAATYRAMEDPLYVLEREGRVLTFERHLRPIERLIGPGRGRRLLDIGCHIGVFLEIAQAHGWEAWGVEPSRWAVEIARARGLRVVEGTLREADFSEGWFDVVTMWDVIEHLSDPMGELREIHRILKPGGWVVIHTMDIESPFARVLGARWPWLMEMHLYYFSRRTLRRMLERAGFQVHHTAAEGRYLRLGYLATRVRALFPSLGSLLVGLVRRARLEGQTVYINLGDLFTAYAQKRMSPSNNL